MEMYRILSVSLLIVVCLQGFTQSSPVCPAGLTPEVHVFNICDLITQPWYENETGILACPGVQDRVCHLQTCVGGGSNDSSYHFRDSETEGIRLTNSQCCSPDKLKACPNLCSDTCATFPGAKCEMNNCSGCKAEWFYGDVEVSSKCVPSAPATETSPSTIDGSVNRFGPTVLNV